MMWRQHIAMCLSHLSHCYLLGMKWHNQFHVDLLHPYGLQSALFIFDTIEDMVEWILVTSFQTPDILHYLDDFITAGPFPVSTVCI